MSQINAVTGKRQKLQRARIGQPLPPRQGSSNASSSAPASTPVPASPQNVRWQVMYESGWTDFPPESNAIIVAAVRDGSTQAVVTVRGQKYVVDTQVLTQFKKSDTSRQREIRCVSDADAGAGEGAGGGGGGGGGSTTGWGAPRKAGDSRIDRADRSPTKPALEPRPVFEFKYERLPVRKGSRIFKLMYVHMRCTMTWACRSFHSFFSILPRPFLRRGSPSVG